MMEKVRSWWRNLRGRFRRGKEPGDDSLSVKGIREITLPTESEESVRVSSVLVSLLGDSRFEEGGGNILPSSSDHGVITDLSSLLVLAETFFAEPDGIGPVDGMEFGDVFRLWDLHNRVQEELHPRPYDPFGDEWHSEPPEDLTKYALWDTVHFAKHVVGENLFVLHHPREPDETPVEKLRRLTHFLADFPAYRFPRCKSEPVEQTLNRLLTSARRQRIIIPLWFRNP
ncbi:uncharacterized protein [Centruroides vittatus]|uniref:uncharacterized protein n=1 Tax=Centruroides vittatus TaxID=120091 RepID=UPI00350E9CA3